MPEKRNCTESSTFTAYTLYSTLCPDENIWKDKANLRNKGKNKRQIVSLPTLPCP